MLKPWSCLNALVLSAVVVVALGCANSQKEMEPTQPLEPVTLLVIGDSTVQTYDEGETIAGWGQMLPEFLAPEATVVNRAKSGTSSKSFMGSGLWEQSLTTEPTPHYVLIQFGHNDAPSKGPDRATDPETTYAENLRKYIADSRAIGATPLLVTPMERRTFTADGKTRMSLDQYAAAMRRVAEEENVGLVDLNLASIDLYNFLGEEGGAKLSRNDNDRTHFSPYGAKVMAQLVAEQLPDAAPQLEPYVQIRLGKAHENCACSH